MACSGRREVEFVVKQSASERGPGYYPCSDKRVQTLNVWAPCVRKNEPSGGLPAVTIHSQVGVGGGAVPRIPPEGSLVNIGK